MRHNSVITDQSQAWRDRIKNREKIFSALSDIPTVLCVALQKWRFFKSDPQLWLAIKQLVDDSIDAIRFLIEVLLPNSNSPASFLRRLAHSIPQREANKIEQIIEVVNHAVKNVETHIERLDRTRSAETYFHVQNIEVTATEIREALSVTNELVAAGIARIQETIQDNRKRMEHFIKSKFDGLKQNAEKQMNAGFGLVTEEVRRIMERVQMVENSQTSFYHVVGEEQYKRSEESHCIPSEDTMLTSRDRSFACCCSAPASDTASYYGPLH